MRGAAKIDVHAAANVERRLEEVAGPPSAPPDWLVGRARRVADLLADRLRAHLGVRAPGPEGSPSDYPYSRSGRLRDSVRSEVKITGADVGVEFGAHAPHAGAVHDGGPGRRPRPFVRRCLEESGPEIGRILDAPLTASETGG